LRKAKSKTVRLAGSHVISTCATIAALLLFVALGSQILPAAVQGVALPDSASTLRVAFLLNIAIILFGWRRSKDLKEALEAYEAAERSAQRNANTDPGTNLANRRELMRSLSEALESGAGGQFLVLDLDHFKRLNDLHGHLAGDKVLLRVAEVMQKSAPAGACCARTGGDEFAVLMPGCDEKGAEAIAEKIRSALATPMFTEGAQVHVTASIGLASLPTCDDEEEVLRHSDVALYAAKRNGRDRIESTSSGAPDEPAVPFADRT
jgi:diguanylate cyclase (GGDEF)-like protein